MAVKHSSKGSRSRSESAKDCHLATRGGMYTLSRFASANWSPTSSAKVLMASYRIRRFLRPYVAQAFARVSKMTLSLGTSCSGVDCSSRVARALQAAS